MRRLCIRVAAVACLGLVLGVGRIAAQTPSTPKGRYRIAYATCLVGSTGSNDFPVTAGTAQTKLNGKGDAFVVKLVPRRAP